jgi:hypothetical protein
MSEMNDGTNTGITRGQVHLIIGLLIANLVAVLFTGNATFGQVKEAVRYARGASNEHEIDQLARNLERGLAKLNETCSSPDTSTPDLLTRDLRDLERSISAELRIVQDACNMAATAPYLAR